MLSVTMHKDIGEYEKKIIMGLSARTLISIIFSVVVAVLVGIWFHALRLPSDVTSIVIVAITLPIWAGGFYKPLGMKLEKFIPLWWRFNFGDEQIAYKNDNPLHIFVKNSETQKDVLIRDRTARIFDEIAGIETIDFEAFYGEENE